MREPLGLNDFLLPPPVNGAPFDQANEIENLHLGQIDFKPKVAYGKTVGGGWIAGVSCGRPLAIHYRRAATSFSSCVVLAL